MAKSAIAVSSFGANPGLYKYKALDTVMLPSHACKVVVALCVFLQDFVAFSTHGLYISIRIAVRLASFGGSGV
eukprot:406713-Amphidinium_carterae.1